MYRDVAVEVERVVVKEVQVPVEVVVEKIVERFVEVKEDRIVTVHSPFLFHSVGHHEFFHIFMTSTARCCNT